MVLIEVINRGFENGDGEKGIRPDLLRGASTTSASRSFHNTSRIAVAAFLQHPAVAIRVREVGEAGVVPARGVEPGCETSVPGSNRYLVPDLTDFDSTFE